MSRAARRAKLWDLVGTDYAGLINPPGADENTHIHVLVDCHSRFVYAHAVAEPSTGVPLASWTIVTPIFRHPRQVYSNNTGPFTSGALKIYFGKRGTSIKHGPIYSPQSTGLAKATVKLVKRQLWK